jgi:Protein of unknown function (DUF3108)
MAKVMRILILCAAALAPAPLPAAAGDKVASLEPAIGGLGIAYTIGFWGVLFGYTNFDAKFGGDSYRTSSHFQTSGIVSAFWGATIDASSSGEYTAQTVKPSVYDSFYQRSAAKKERVKVTYGPNGVPVTEADPPYNTKKYPVTDEQKKEALDPLSAVSYVLLGMKSDASKPCGTVAPVFDGRRRYNIEFTYLRDEPVKLETGVYAGKAHLCQMHYNQIAGFKPKILKEGRAFPPIYGWFADIPSAAAPNGHYLIALKIWASTGWGTVAATLTQMKVGGGKGA